MGAQHQVVVVPADLGSVRAARRFVGAAGTQAGLSADVVDTMILLTSELVTNALVHGRSAVDVEVDIDATSVWVFVADAAAGLPRQRNPGPDDVDGRGLVLVEALSAECGVQQRPVGKAVWFRLLRDDVR